MSESIITEVYKEIDIIKNILNNNSEDNISSSSQKFIEILDKLSNYDINYEIIDKTKIGI
jgi:hypothetical protein